MKLPLLIVVLLSVSLPSLGYGQTAVAVKAARSVLEQIGLRGGKSAGEELAKIGGEKAAQEVMEKAVKEGGEILVEKTSRYAIEYGPIVLRAAKQSPSRFVAALDSTPAALRMGAIQEIKREPELMSRLVYEHSETALVVAAKHPSVGPKVLASLGSDSSQLLMTQSTDRIIRVSRIADDIAATLPSQRRELLQMISAAPEKTLNLLESHPNILKTGAVLTAFLASKDQILGSNEVHLDKDGMPINIRKPGVIDATVSVISNSPPARIFAAVAGIVVALFSVVWLRKAFKPS